ncbi:MAG: hypothetical protein EXR73_11395 [Myxococcales bacterium]|nr:hypothetical protein [Myxococcales bacterium]
MDLLGGLNPEQRAAVEYGAGPLMVLAGAGSGKTRVLTHRIAWQVQQGVPPWRILAVTFTNKAAGEMRERLARLLGPQAAGMWIGTFHATCAKLLRRYADRVGLTPTFTIFDDDDQIRVVKRLLKHLAVSDQITARAVLSRIDRAKNAGDDLTKAPRFDYLGDVVARVFPSYQARLQRENAVDFNDLLLKTLELLAHEELGPVLSHKFTQVLVDEFQDTNPVQYRLVQHFSSGTRNLCVVGDDDQSIYRWRGAEPKNLLEFDHDFPDAGVVRLEQNYRSTQVILGCANAVIEKNTLRHDKKLWTAREGGEPVLIETCADERAEADFVGRAIGGLIASDGRDPGDFAVLYRTHAQSRVLEETLRARRIAYRIVGGVSFFQRREVKDLTEYLRLIANPLADTAFDRVVNAPPRGIGDTTVAHLREHARASGTSLLDATRAMAAGAGTGPTSAARRKLGAFADVIDGLVELVAAGTKVAQLVTQVITRTDYARRLQTDGEGEPDTADRLRNLGELVAAAAAFDDEAEASAAAAEGAAEGALMTGSVSAFLERIALTATTDQPDGRGQAVTLMTIHAAKGLEFPVVFVTGLEEGVFPSDREDEDDRGARLEEERRLAYVAFTRARDRLILSHALQRRSYDQTWANAPSRFLHDLPPDLVAVREQRSAPPPRPAARESWRHAASGSGGASGRAAGGAAVRASSVAAAPRFDEHDQRSGFDNEAAFDAGASGGVDGGYMRGTRVRHRIYGVGSIEGASGAGPDGKLTIRFPAHGVKTIIARFVERVG